jgi:hypothetical protein
MSALLKTHETTIGGKKFILRLLNVAEGRKVLSKMQTFLPFWTSDDVKNGMGPIAAIGLGGGLSQELLDDLCEAFGKVSQVVFEDDRQLALSDPKNQNEAFAGAYEDMLQWLDESIQYNYGGFLEKLKGVLRSRAADAPKKA